MIFSLVSFLILAMVSQLNDKSLFLRYDFLYFGPLVEAAVISYKIGNSYLELSRWYISYFLLVPRTCASTVMTSPSKLLSSAILIIWRFISQSWHKYICSNFKPVGWISVIYLGCVFVRVLNTYARLCFAATIAGPF